MPIFLYNFVTTDILPDRRNAAMHIARSDRSLDFIARGCSIGTVLLFIPVLLLTLLFGLCISRPELCAEVTLFVIRTAHTLGLVPDTLLMLTTVVPLLHALLQYSNRLHGIGGGRCLLYTAVYIAPAAFACLYYLGLLLASTLPLR